MYSPWASSTALRFWREDIGELSWIARKSIHRQPVHWSFFPEGSYPLGPTFLSERRVVHFRRRILNSRFLIMHGTRDVVTDPSFSQKFYDQAFSKDKVIKLVEGAYFAMGIIKAAKYSNNWKRSQSQNHSNENTSTCN